MADSLPLFDEWPEAPVPHKKLARRVARAMKRLRENAIPDEFGYDFAPEEIENEAYEAWMALRECEAKMLGRKPEDLPMHPDFEDLLARRRYQEGVLADLTDGTEKARAADQAVAALLGACQDESGRGSAIPSTAPHGASSPARPEQDQRRRSATR